MTLEEIQKKAQDLMWREDGIGGYVLNQNAVLEFVEQAFSAGYKEGHIDHQLVLEASTEVLADRMKRTVNERAGEPMEYSFSAKEIKDRAFSAGREKGIGECPRRCCENTDDTDARIKIANAKIAKAARLRRDR